MIWVYFAIENIVLILLVYFIVKKIYFKRSINSEEYIRKELRVIDKKIKDISMLMGDDNV